MERAEWTDLAARLVEINLAIENLDGWATRPDDVEDLKELEALRGELEAALTSRHLPRRLRRRLDEPHPVRLSGAAPNDPRD
ncbi:MAG TPA: hypothetical protein VFU56_09610 [Gaiellaceae bacterium]|nr:hypothetical protein [Gaiellaceae bacterium]